MSLTGGNDSPCIIYLGYPKIYNFVNPYIINFLRLIEEYIISLIPRPTTLNPCLRPRIAAHKT